MRPETKLWIEKVNQDVKTVEILLQSNEGPPGIICFHCQQAAEKLLKAFGLIITLNFYELMT